MIKLVIFDLDGTLVDSREAIVESFSLAAQLMNIRIDSSKIVYLIGKPLMDVVRGMLLEELDEINMLRLANIRRRIMDIIWKEKVKLYPDVAPVLKELKNRGLLLGIASSSIVGRILRFLEFFKIRKYFDVVSGVVNGKIKGKPHPDTIIYVLNTLGISPREAIYVGDMEVDYTAALKSGVEFIKIVREHNRGIKWNTNPTITINSLYELTYVIEKLK